MDRRQREAWIGSRGTRGVPQDLDTDFELERAGRKCKENAGHARKGV